MAFDVTSFREILTSGTHYVETGHMQRSMSLITGFAAILSFIEVAQQHYTGSFSRRVMYAPLIGCLLLAITGIAGAFDPRVATVILPWVSVLFLGICLIGFGFHIRGIARKPGGWTRNPIVNIVMGPPLFAPLVLGLSGLLGISAALFLPEEAPTQLSPDALERLRLVFAGATAVYAILNGFEALYSHYKSRFKSVFQWTPIILAPLLMIAGVFAIFNPDEIAAPLSLLSIVAIIAGLMGMCFHINGIRKRPGGWPHIIYNFLYGPPVFAPLLFAATGFLGLLATHIGRPL